MRQAARRQRTRGKVLDAAGRVFARRGYHDTTLREIAADAGVSKGAVYYNFESKDDLFLALLEARMDERVQNVEAVFESARADESEAARSGRAARDYVENLKRNRAWIGLFFEFAARAARDDEFRDRFAARFKEFWAGLAEVVERQARERGVELPLPPGDLAVAIDLLGIGFMLPRILDPEGVPDGLLGQALGYMLRGVAAEAE